MKKVLIKVSATFFLFLLSGIISNIYSEEWIEKVVEDKKIEINNNALLVVDHEYGNVRCKNWDQNTIAVKVTVRVETDDSDKAEKIINRIIVDVHGNKDKVVATCDLNQKGFKSKNIKVNIDFDIYMPETISLQFEHKFGNAYIESVIGSTSISSEYGSIEIVSLGNIENELEMSFGEANIHSMNNGEIEVSYSRLELHKAIGLSIESEYSDITVDEVDHISLEIEGGNANIGQVRIFEAETSFTNLEIKNVSETVVAETNYGNLCIKNVDKAFTSIVINNEFGAVDVNIDKGANYSLLAEGEYCSFSYPDKYANISYKKKSHSSTIVKGIIGKGIDPKSKLNIESEYGSVTITAR